MNFEKLTFLFTPAFANRGQVRLDFDEAGALYGAVHNLQKGIRGGISGVEIGRFAGGSTVLLASAIAATGSLLSIDLKPKNDEALLAQLKELGLDERVNLQTGDSGNFAYKPEEHGKDFSFVFVDGGHSYAQAKADHLAWGRRLRPGGLIIHHDMAKTRPNATQIPDLARLRDEILINQKECVDLVAEAGSLSIFKRRGGCWKTWG